MPLSKPSTLNSSTKTNNVGALRQTPLGETLCCNKGLSPFSPVGSVGAAACAAVFTGHPHPLS